MSNIHVFGNREKIRQVSENELSGITDKHRRFESGGLLEETANTPDIRLLPPPPTTHPPPVHYFIWTTLYRPTSCMDLLDGGSTDT